MATFKKKKKRKREKITSVGEDMEKLEPCALLVGMNNIKKKKLHLTPLVRQNYFSLLTEHFCTQNGVGFSALRNSPILCGDQVSYD